VGRIRFDAASGTTSGNFERILTSVPPGANHWTRTLRRGPDGWFYLSIGSTCNACEEDHPWRATMLRFRADGSDVEVYAIGLRNSVGFDWAPWDGGLYATDNGRDLLGDDFPPCELNKVEAGRFYGWPYVNGFGAKDPDLGERRPDLTADAVDPVHGFRAHNAPLGISFLRHSTTVAEFGRSALVALHGSWNRSTPDGYKVVRLTWGADGRISEDDFVRGFERAGNVIGRPVDVVEAADGAIFISDDYAGVVYRVVRTGVVASAVGKAPKISGAAANVAKENARRELASLSAAQRAAADDRAKALVIRHACASCHSPGTPLAERWSTLAERYSIASLSDFFLAPTPPMPAFPLSAEEREALAVHLLGRSLAQ
jgi:mono/diheme cytochrome c family protein